MANEQKLISAIEDKISKLISLNIKLKEENAKLHQHIGVLDDEIETLSTELKQKRNELFNVTLANTLESEHGVEDSKRKINNLLDEIDRCIEVLSD